MRASPIWTIRLAFVVVGTLLLVPGTSTESSARCCPATFQVLFLYTNEALTQAENEVIDLGQVIDRAVTSTNKILKDSRVPARVERVGSPTEVDIDERLCKDEETSKRYRKSYAALLEEVRELPAANEARAAVKADQVCLVVYRGQGAHVGEAYTWSNPFIDFSPWAYSVISLDGIQTRTALAHELGHNWGCAHDVESTPGRGRYCDSFAWKQKVGEKSVCTLMTEGKCPGQDREEVFSNPALRSSVNGRSVALGRWGRANNAATITRSRRVIARWGDNL